MHTHTHTHTHAHRHIHGYFRSLSLSREGEKERKRPHSNCPKMACNLRIQAKRITQLTPHLTPTKGSQSEWCAIFIPSQQLSVARFWKTFTDDDHINLGKLPWTHHRGYMWQVEVQLHTLTPALHRRKESASRLGRFTPGERANGMQLCS